MSDATDTRDQATAGLIEHLVADLRPVSRLASPWLRAALWLGAVAVLAVALAMISDLAVLRQRLMAAPDLRLAVVGSTLTAVLATIAAFQIGLPDRSRSWALLPVPGLVLWLSASGLGCARAWLVAGLHDATMQDSKHCMIFIIGLSLPLSLVLFGMLRRGYSLNPSLAGGVAGLAVAAAAATLLTFFHPYDASVSDLAVHAVAVLVVVAANRVLGGALLARRDLTVPRIQQSGGVARP